MKQIFDWLREQIANEINVPTLIRKDYDFDDGLIHARDLINEAEEKWEADCCEWKVLHEKCFIQNPHTKRLFSNEESMRNVYCNTCGKPIKISEVE